MFVLYEEDLLPLKLKSQVGYRFSELSLEGRLALWRLGCREIDWHKLERMVEVSPNIRGPPAAISVNSGQKHYDVVGVYHDSPSTGYVVPAEQKAEQINAIGNLVGNGAVVVSESGLERCYGGIGVSSGYETKKFGSGIGIDREYQEPRYHGSARFEEMILRLIFKGSQQNIGLNEAKRALALYKIAWPSSWPERDEQGTLDVKLASKVASMSKELASLYDRVVIVVGMWHEVDVVSCLVDGEAARTEILYHLHSDKVRRLVASTYALPLVERSVG